MTKKVFYFGYDVCSIVFIFRLQTTLTTGRQKSKKPRAFVAFWIWYCTSFVIITILVISSTTGEGGNIYAITKIRYFRFGFFVVVEET